ncbi:aminotransferase class IV [Alkaliphilus transvaalensis]|uniref:aminotransferase class IV n=1 Tax=Alkaliphilus transvaalensis TaxID=114628 RepID=UPI00047AE9BB|nr:aminotransferase class IV [Alkaliphilus transvaalensis]
MYISINGRIIAEDESKISPTSEGFMFGYGAFETLKFTNNKIYFLKEHYQRIKKASEELRLPLSYDYSEVETFAYRLIEKNKMQCGALKINYAKNKDDYYLILTLRENNYNEETYKRGFKICFTSLQRNPYSLLTYIKSNNYMENLIVRQQGLENGFDEVIFKNIHGDLCEGTISNLFFIRSDELYTPKTECGLLAGIMREKVLEIALKEGIKINVGCFKKEDLLKADEVFLTNSLMEIMPVVQLEEKKFNLKNNKMTQMMMEKLKRYRD